jgi:hypothetical protein
MAGKSCLYSISRFMAPQAGPTVAPDGSPSGAELDRYSKAQGASQNATAARDQVEEQDDQSDHEQNVNQAARNMKAEPQQPQDQKNHENCPKHIFSVALRAPWESKFISGRPQAIAIDC